MKNRILFYLLLIISLANCRKSLTADELQGTWIEQDGNNSKLIFSADTFFFFHDAVVDSLSYTLDKKHFVIWTAPFNSTSGGKSYQLEYHKRKKILVVMGLFPSGFGNASKNYYKR